MYDDVIKQLEIELARLNDVCDRAERHWHDAKDDRDAIARTIAVFARRSARGKDTLAITTDELAGMTQERAVIHIAEKNGGVLPFSAAKQLLVNAGLIANPKNAATIMYTMIQRSGRFEPVRRGVYQLVAEPETTRERGGVRILDTADSEADWSDVADEFKVDLIS